MKTEYNADNHRMYKFKLVKQVRSPWLGGALGARPQWQDRALPLLAQENMRE